MAVQPPGWIPARGQGGPLLCMLPDAQRGMGPTKITHGLTVLLDKPRAVPMALSPCSGRSPCPQHAHGWAPTLGPGAAQPGQQGHGTPPSNNYQNKLQ